MNEIFNFNRFSRIFAVDLNRIVREYGLTFIVLCLSEAIIYIIASLVMLTAGKGTVTLEDVMRDMIFEMSQFALILTMPQKCYGMITDRRKGAAYLTIPASSFEKTLSMILFTAMIVPVLFVLVTKCVDTTMYTLIPGAIEKYDYVQKTGIDAPIGANISMIASEMPTMLLGAIYFKKGKAIKTLLFCSAVTIILYVLLSILSNGNIEIDEMISNINTTVILKKIINYTIVAAMCVWVYFRVRKIQQ